METYTRDGVTYEVRETGAYVGELTRRWFRRRAEAEARDANEARLHHGVRYEVRKVGFLRYAIVALQNKLYPAGTVPDAGILPRGTLDKVEMTIEKDLGLPPTWRCACGGKPFVGHACARCGTVQQ